VSVCSAFLFGSDILPRLDNKIDIGTIVQIVVTLVLVGIAYGTLDAKVAHIDTNGSTAVKTLREDISKLVVAIAVQTEATNSLKEQLVLERAERVRLMEQLQSMQTK
jgi:hypothetical protein